MNCYIIYANCYVLFHFAQLSPFENSLLTNFINTCTYIQKSLTLITLKTLIPHITLIPLNPNTSHPSYPSTLILLIPLNPHTSHIPHTPHNLYNAHESTWLLYLIWLFINTQYTHARSTKYYITTLYLQFTENNERTLFQRNLFSTK